MPANRDQEAIKACADSAGVGTGGVHRARKARNHDTKSPMSSGSSTMTPETSSNAAVVEPWDVERQ